MKRLKLTAGYEEGVHKELIQKVITIPIPAEKEQDVFDFEAFVTSKAEEMKLSIISSNVSVLTWTDDVPTEKMAEMAAEVDKDLSVITSPRLPDDPENIMVFCPVSMEDMIQSGEFAEIFREVRDTYESMYWSGTVSEYDLIIYFKDGKTSRTQWKK